MLTSRPPPRPYKLTFVFFVIYLNVFATKMSLSVKDFLVLLSVENGCISLAAKVN